ncbi:hypothetical protein PsB1_1240 [Candidatus Phycosocius spiralis]|uniref:Uncharacterized protein n=1 Tax=Candidatus Phycosocius spiralis TaxID=2815099 RepID=A0ABQ4PVT0_9PROT|nr:hypothetical protein PsB1_1240 [Candidatus Phycosocius spiralis]
MVIKDVKRTYPIHLTPLNELETKYVTICDMRAALAVPIPLIERNQSFGPLMMNDLPWARS